MNGYRPDAEFGWYGHPPFDPAAYAGAPHGACEEREQEGAAEETKVALRNIRRDANEAVKKLKRPKRSLRNEAKKAQEDMQKLVDKYVKSVDSVRTAKEKEIMEV